MAAFSHGLFHQRDLQRDINLAEQARQVDRGELVHGGLKGQCLHGPAFSLCHHHCQAVAAVRVGDIRGEREGILGDIELLPRTVAVLEGHPERVAEHQVVAVRVAAPGNRQEHQQRQEAPQDQGQPEDVPAAAPAAAGRVRQDRRWRVRRPACLPCCLVDNV